MPIYEMYQMDKLFAMLKKCQKFMFICVFMVSTNLSAAIQQDDIRVVIDVSGSMKKTDPSNLRVSAMKLLNGLIPEGAKAGVWTFGRYVNMTVKWGKVNKAWRKRADIGAEEIHSNALFTNIESALERATKDWKGKDPSTRRNLILLTDGQVDISKDKTRNLKSRQSILDNSIKRLREAGVHVQAIALSQDADQVLLRRLALETEGSYEIAQNASELQKIFFKMFERATSPNSIKISDNQFKVDSTIKEMTILVFRKPGSKSTIIFPPDSNRISARHKGGSIWRSDEGYDLITIKKPAKGLWNIDADMDPDNRLMVVTDLRLDVTGIPAYVSPGQAINLSAALYNKGKQISKNSFLRFVKFKLTHTNNEDVSTEIKLKHSRDRRQKGQYLYDAVEGLEEGNHSLLVTADSQTFNRSRRVDVTVQWPVKVTIRPADKPGNYTFMVESRDEYLKPESLQPIVFLESPNGQREALSLESRDNIWSGLVETGLDGVYQAQLSIKAEDQNGQGIELDLGKFSMVGVYRMPEPGEQETSTDSESLMADAGSEADEIDLANAGSELEAGEDWIATTIIIGVSNLVIVLLVGGAFLMLRRKSVTDEILLE